MKLKAWYQRKGAERALRYFVGRFMYYDTDLCVYLTPKKCTRELIEELVAEAVDHAGRS